MLSPRRDFESPIRTVAKEREGGQAKTPFLSSEHFYWHRSEKTGLKIRRQRNSGRSNGRFSQILLRRRLFSNPQNLALSEVFTFEPLANDISNRLLFACSTIFKTMSIMKNLLCSLALLTFFAACNGDSSKKTKVADPLPGNWLTKSYVDSTALLRSPMSVWEGCEELVFATGCDTMLYVGVGSEAGFFPWQKLNDTTVRVFGFADPHLDFFLSGDGKTLSCVDSFSQRRYVFAKLDSAFATGDSGHPKLKTANERWFNQALLAGTYVEMSGEGGSPKSLTFHPDGKLEGWNGYSKYFICASGICTSLSDDDFLTVQKGDEPGVDFGWELKDKTLEIYELKDASAGEGIPQYVREKVAMRLNKVK